MSCCKSQIFCINQGDDIRIIVTVRDSTGALVDISEASQIRFEIARSVASVAVISKSLGDGIELANPTSFFLDLSNSETESLSGSYYYESEIITDQDLVYTTLSGRIKVKPTLIKPE